MYKTLIRLLVLICAVLFTYSCAEKPKTPPPEPVQQTQKKPGNLLRIGMSPNYPPIVFIQAGEITGVEADFAHLLANEFGRPVEMETYPWDQLITALLDGKIDIIMSGMTVTTPRKMRIAFTTPYLNTGLIAAFRLKDADKYSTVNGIMKSNASVGVVGNTTSEAFVRKNFPFASRIIVLQQADDAAWELKGRTIDIFVHDAPSIMWLVSENESEITGLWTPLDRELLAWGVRRDDKKLKNSLDAVLEKWKQDGTLNRILDKWLPFRH